MTTPDDAPTVQKVCDTITTAVREGRLVPGQRLAEVDLAKRLGVSRPSVREAFRQLASDGLLHAEPYRGVSVRQLSRREVDDLFAIRGVLEGYAVRQATPALTANPTLLDHIQSDLDEAAAKGDLRAMSDHNLRYHHLFAEVTGNQLLIDLLNRLANSAYWLQFRVLIADDKVLETNDRHMAITTAVRQGDGETAERLMIAHVDHTRALVQALDDSHFTPAPDRPAPSL